MPYKFIIQTEIKVFSTSGKLMRKRDGERYVFYGETKKECREAARAAHRKGREEWKIEN